MNRKNKRIVRYKSPINLNVGIVIFGIIFLYVAINVIIYFSTDRVKYYEVVEGAVSDTSNHVYTAIALRKEKVFYTDNAGYINFYARENSRVSKNTTLYSIDESGKINDFLAQMSDEEKTLSDDNINTIKEQLYSFSSNFDEMNYDSVYNFKSTLQGTVVELINMNALQSISKSLGSSKEGQFQISKSGSAGIVEYYIDNYEDLTPKKLKSSMFDKKNYKVATIETGKLVEAKAPIYKTINQEEWKLAIQLSDSDVKKYKDTTAVKIKFKKDGTSVTTNFNIVKGSDKKSYGILTLQKYMIRYADERFVDIEIVEQGATGLKIPKKAIVNKKFYVIPKAYKTSGKDTKEKGFIVRVYNKSKVKDMFKAITITTEKDGYCFIPTDELQAGDEIILPKNKNKSSDSSSKEPATSSENETTAAENETTAASKSESIYVIKDTQTLSGVYNINNGYTQFVRVNILAETGEYYIIQSEDNYGLMVYDHIILDGSLVKENQIIFQ